MLLKFKNIFFVLVLCTIFCSQVYYAQPTSLHFTNLNVNEGISNNFIHTVFKDSRGFLWLGSDDGLNLYDGEKFTVFKHNRFDSTSICNNKIRSIEEDNDGMLWIGTNDGVSKLNPINKKATTYVINQKGKDVFTNGFICKLFLSAKKQLWVYNESGVGTFDSKSNSFKIVLDKSFFKDANLRISSFFVDKQDVVWVGTFNGIYSVDIKKHKFEKYLIYPNEKDKNIVTDIKKDKEDNLWITLYAGGIARLKKNESTFKVAYYFNKTTFLNNIPIFNNLIITKDNTIWATSNRGLYRFSANDLNFTNYKFNPQCFVFSTNKDDCIASNFVNCIIESDGDYWIGSDAGLSAIYKSNHHFKKKENVYGDIFKLQYTKEGSIYCAAWYANGLNKYDSAYTLISNQKFVPKTVQTADNAQISDVIETKDGKLWVATFNGLTAYLPNNKGEKYYCHLEGKNSIASNKLTSICMDGEENLWIASYNKGISVIKKDGSFEHFTKNSKETSAIPSNLVWGLLKASNGYIWIATNEGIAYYNTSQHKMVCIKDVKIKTEVIPLGIVYSIFESSTKSIWFGGGNGLFELTSTNTTNYYSTEEGLPNIVVNSITEDNEKNIWVATDNGIACLKAVSRQINSFGYQNGIPNSNVKMIQKGMKGELYIATNSSLYQFYPKELLTQMPLPPIYIRSISFSGMEANRMGFAGNRRIENLGKYDYQHNNVTFDFIAPVYNSYKSILYQYKLEGVDKDWLNAGNLHTANYSNLTPGTYSFKARTMNSNNQTNAKEAMVMFTIVPAYWQTVWFKLIITCCLVLILYDFYWMKQKRKKEIEKIQTQIARNLHDDIGSTLSSINILSVTAQANLSKDHLKTASTLSSINISAQKMLDTMDDIIWGIKANNNSFEHLFTRMREYCSHTLEPKNIRFEFDIKHSSFSTLLPLSYNYELYLVFKEIVNNAMKHSHCASVQILIKQESKKMILLIKDDGKGFDSTIVSNRNGLKNIVARANALNGMIDIKSTIDKGTVIQLIVPLT
jgi:ligand-binding sensor domain-containing protein/signal transduction histidine kinase